MDQAVSKLCKLSHKQFRAMLKKFRRKNRRQHLAKEREQQELIEQQKRESSPGYKEREEELRRNIELYEQFEDRERIRQHKLWLLREEQAQNEFRRKQQQLEIEKIKREEERKRILEEFEKQQFVESQALEEDRKKKSQKEDVLKETLSNLAEDDGPWHNPIAPENYYIAGIEREQCMFFTKTGACRFGDRCSRGHTRPEVSCTILIKGMYSHFSIGQSATDDYDTDIALEYEDKERYQDFKNFYKDVLPEFKKFGKIVNFKVCSNFEPHLRGNVYVQFAREKDALEAFKSFNGRYYAGKQLSCEFTHVIRWRQAICGLYGRKMCPKGNNCNFLHVFRSPNDEFWEADRDLPLRFLNRSSVSSRNRGDRSGNHSLHHKEKHESRSSRHEPTSDRYDHRSDRYEHRSERYEPRSDRFEARNDRYEPRSDRYESRSDRHEPKSDRYLRKSERDESRKDRHDFKNKRSESSHYDVRSSGSSCNSSEEDNCHSSVLKTDDHELKNRKRYRESRSRSSSLSDVSNGKKSNYKKKKHKKKKSKKSKKHNSSDSES